MIYLLLSMVCSSAVFIIFKLINNYKLKTYNVIVVNYLLASILGFLLNKEPLNFTAVKNANWLLLAILIGILFIVMFFLMAQSSQKIGISTTSIAAKMSVIIPIVFSIIQYNEPVYIVKILGIIIAIVSVALIVYKKQEAHKPKITKWLLILPVIIFIGTGIIDALIKYAQQEFVPDNILPVFSSILFGIAFIIGLLFLPFQKKNIITFKKYKVWVFGIMLGAFNYGTIFFIIKSLNTIKLDSSIIFGLNNLGIVFLSIIIAFLFFKEKLNKINYLGIVTSIISIIMLFFAKNFTF